MNHQPAPGSPAWQDERDAENATELAQAVSALADVRRRIAGLKAAENVYAKRVRELLPVGTQGKEIAGERVTVTQAMKFSPELARKILSPVVLASIAVPVIDPKLAEQMLPGAVFEQCKVPNGQPRITFGKS